MQSSLDDLANLVGVSRAWTDAWGQPQVVSDEHLGRVVEAVIGRELASSSDIDDALNELSESHIDVPPVIVCWDGDPAPLMNLPQSHDVEIAFEDGISMSLAEVTQSWTVLPVGYHQLMVDGEHSSVVMSAPTAAASLPTGLSGVISPIYSLRSDTDRGIGTLRELRIFADMLNREGIDVVGTLPLLAAFADDPSPYAPASRRAWNEAFLDVDRVPGTHTALAADGADATRVDYSDAHRRVDSWLDDYVAIVAETPGLIDEVETFGKGNPDTARYADFRSATDRHGRDWRAWSTAIDVDPHRRLHHLTAQWLMDRQIRQLDADLASRGQLLYLDLPIGCHPDGYDIWTQPDLFASASLGAPPDTLFVGGQDWGLPAVIPAVARLDGHLQFRLALRHQLEAGGLLRIDHALGLHRSWWVPHGMAASEGAYVAQPTDELFAVVCIESHRSGTPVVGENLGTVTAEIERRLDTHRLAGMVVAPDASADVSERDVVAVSSHDTPSIAAWLAGSDIDDMRALGVFDEEREVIEREQRARAVDGLGQRFGSTDPGIVVDGLSAWMAASSAAVALMTMDDLVGERRRQNVPGTYRERPNWTVRHDSSLESLSQNDAFRRSLAAGRRSS
ncbi:MAG: 4-alpha-glucanotransferase [Acidimicrobiia bacterium]